MNLNERKSLIALILVLLAVSMRIIDHPFNATPMVAIMLFSASIFTSWSWKIGVPFTAMLVSDVALELITGNGLHDSIYLVYFAFALVFMVGYFMLKNVTVLKVLASSTIGSLIFFLVTNFAFFYPAAAISNPALGQYSHDFNGIMAAYTAGVPFYKNMFVGDILFTSILFGAYFAVNKFVFKKTAELA